MASNDKTPATPLGDDPPPNLRSCGGSWTIPMLCAGIGLIAACVLIPLSEENRQLVYEREQLRLDLVQIQKQVTVNDEFLKNLGDDPTLAERLAQRQMKTIREGSEVVDLESTSGKQEMSPFLLVSLPPPAPMPAYAPVGGRLATLCLTGKSRLFLVGCGLMLCAGGLVLGGTRKEL